MGAGSLHDFKRLVIVKEKILKIVTSRRSLHRFLSNLIELSKLALPVMGQTDISNGKKHSHSVILLPKMQRLKLFMGKH